MSKDSTEVLVSGPLGAFSTGYANELTRQGYAPASVRLQMKMLADLSDWLLSHGIHLGDLKSSDLDGFLSNRRAAGYTRYVSYRFHIRLTWLCKGMR